MSYLQPSDLFTLLINTRILYRNMPNQIIQNIQTYMKMINTLNCMTAQLIPPDFYHLKHMMYLTGSSFCLTKWKKAALSRCLFQKDCVIKDQLIISSYQNMRSMDLKSFYITLQDVSYKMIQKMLKQMRYYTGCSV